MIAAALEDSHEAWHEDAVATIVGLSLAHEEFTADDLAREMRKPPHPNAPGQAFAAARNLGYIEAVGDKASTNKSRKHGRLRVWTRRTDSKGAAA